jgi:YesN/AraC family two-component response regulator
VDNASNGRGRRVAVLICDDNDSIRELLREVIKLRSSLCVIGEAADGNEAVVEATRLQPDVILLDIAMPHRTGLDAITQLRRVAPAAKIIVFSSFLAAEVAEQALALGAVRFLAKGASPNAINDAIEAAGVRRAGGGLPSSPRQG